MKKLINKKLCTIFALCFLIISLIVFVCCFSGNNVVQTAAEITNWGLSFQNPGKCPVGNASAESLKKYDSYFVGNTAEKTIYLTFDAGYENGYTESILDTLKKHNVKATFFLVGNFLETSPDIVKRMVAEGHTIGNHTYTHPDMSNVLDEASFKAELSKVEDKYKEITGQDMVKLYRPPQGKFCVSNLEMAQKMGYKTIFWSLAYVDWYNDKQPTREEAFSKLIPRMHDGAVLLLHSTSKTNSEILDELLTKYEESGYVFGELKDISF